MSFSFNLALVASGLVNITWLAYLTLINDEKVPRRPINHAVAIGAGLLTALLAIITPFTEGNFPALGTLFFGLWAIILGGLFFFMWARASLPAGELPMRDGQRLPQFELPDSDGRRVRVRDWRGQRVLLKFYRGHWCPHCVAELRRHKRLGPLLTRYEINVVGVSRDGVTQAKRHKKRDDLPFTLLADPELKVINQFGLVQEKGVVHATHYLGEFPVSLPLGLGNVALPTTLLIDEKGIVRWIDQPGDYRVRTSSDRIYAALVDAFGPLIDD